MHLTGEIVFTVTSSPTVVACTIVTKAQTNNGISYHNVANGDVTMTTNITNLISTTAGGFFNCGIANGEHKEGTYVGHTTLIGEDTVGAPVSISVNHPTG